MFQAARSDIAAARSRDPAARSSVEVALLYPGVHALWGYRTSRWLWQRGHRMAARSVSAITHRLTGVDIHPGAVIADGVFIDHATGVVIGETAEIGRDVTIYQGVTLGGTSLEPGKRHPTIGERVTIGAGAKILGPITVGEDSRIGANAVVVKAVPPNTVVVGVPGQIISRSQPHTAADHPDLDNSRVPDVIGMSLQSLRTRLERLESEVTGHEEHGGPQPSAEGVWVEEDFAI